MSSAPCKPHPKGKEYHTISCSEIGIMHGWEIFEVGYNPIPMTRNQLKTSPNINTVVLMLQLNTTIWRNGKAVIMDSGFYFLKVIFVNNKEVFLYGSALIKKRRYCHRVVRGEGINK